MEGNMNLKIIQTLLDNTIEEQNKEFDVMFNNTDLVNLIGYLNMNRVAAIAYKNICDKDILYLKKCSDFMKNLEDNYQYGVVKNKFLCRDINFISDILDANKLRYTFLKGAFLSTNVYTKGLRTSNDIDLLVHLEDLKEVEKTLKKNGFVQGYMEYGGNFHEATRREIIMARMNYGEVVPYGYFFEGHLLSLDINLSLDYKPLENDFIIEKMMDRREFFCVNEYLKSPTLNMEDFLIHLCCHLYKEATVYHWVENRRDLTLYKFVDIFMYLNKFINKDLEIKLEENINKFGVNKECYYAIYNTMKIFTSLKKHDEINRLLKNIMPENLDFMDQVIRPETGDVYEYTIDFEQRLLKNNRLLYLRKM